MKTNIVCLALVALAALAFAAELNISGTTQDYSIQVVKTAPVNASIGSEITVFITITNNGTTTAPIRVIERLGNVIPVSPTPLYPVYPVEGYPPEPPSPYLQWNANLTGRSVLELNYTVKTKSVGDLWLGETEVYAGGRGYYSNAAKVVVYCLQNGVCDSSLGESFRNCPEDCPAIPSDATPVPPSTPTPLATVTPAATPLVTPAATPAPGGFQLPPLNELMLPAAVILGIIVLVLLIAGAILLKRK